MDKGVVLGEKDAETGVGVIPADDAMVGPGLVLDAIDLFPRILRERHMGAGLGGAGSLNGSLYIDQPVALLSDQDPADFRLHRAACVLPDAARDFAVDLELDTVV